MKSQIEIMQKIIFNYGKTKKFNKQGLLFLRCNPSKVVSQSYAGNCKLFELIFLKFRGVDKSP